MNTIISDSNNNKVGKDILWRRTKRNLKKIKTFTNIIQRITNRSK